ncbi:MAG: diacylglycerol/lipid kinase family protein [Mycobacteriales bacterium]
MRALVVVNPHATATSRHLREILLQALGRAASVDVAATHYRGHGIALGAQARNDGVDLVVTLGGDGTVNEVVNGLLGDGSLADGPSADTRPLPTFAVVPGGSANVFVRTLGFSRDPIAASAQLLESIRRDRTRAIGLGRVGSRWFTFNAGFGFDAEVIERVERYRSQGREASPALYVQAALAQFARARDRRYPSVTLTGGPGGPVGGLFFGIVANAAPWTYLGPRPVNLLPRASFDTGLDLLAPRSMRTSTLARVAARAAIAARPSGRPRHSMLELHDLDEFTLTSTVPLPVQVDGDFLGRHSTATFTAQSRAITVLAGPRGAAPLRLSAPRRRILKAR